MIPGIPLCVTISLSKGCSAMVKKNVLVRKLAAVETLGSSQLDRELILQLESRSTTV